MQVDVSFQARHAQRECFGSMHVFHNLHRVWKRRLIRAHHWPEHSGDAESSIRRSQLTCCIGKFAGPSALPSPASAPRLMPPCAIVDLGIRFMLPADHVGWIWARCFHRTLASLSIWRCWPESLTVATCVLLKKPIFAMARFFRHALTIVLLPRTAQVV